MTVDWERNFRSSKLLIAKLVRAEAEARQSFLLEVYDKRNSSCFGFHEKSIGFVGFYRRNLTQEACDLAWGKPSKSSRNEALPGSNYAVDKLILAPLRSDESKNKKLYRKLVFPTFRPPEESDNYKLILIYRSNMYRRQFRQMRSWLVYVPFQVACMIHNP